MMNAPCGGSTSFGNKTSWESLPLWDGVKVSFAAGLLHWRLSASNLKQIAISNGGFLERPAFAGSLYCGESETFEDDLLSP